MSATHVRIRRGDTVQLLAGRDRGKSGKVMQVFPRLAMVVVEGLNQRTRHLKRRSSSQPGQKLTFSAPLPVGKVALVCPRCGKPTRVAYTYRQADDGRREKSRTCRRCEQTV